MSDDMAQRLRVIAGLVLVIIVSACGSDNKSHASTRSSVPDCFSAWDGSHIRFKAAVKSRLADQKSFEHRETGFSTGDWPRTVEMRYAARNAFGGMVEAIASGTYKRDCSVTVTTIQK